MRSLIVLILLGTVALADNLPDPALTPGAWRKITRKEICNTQWGKDARAVSNEMKREVFRRYGLSGNDEPFCENPDSQTRRCEVDHRRPRELGGADVLKNLGIQRFYGSCNAHDKDRLENFAHAAVCSRRMTLKAARTIFEGDWREGFKKYIDPAGCGDDLGEASAPR